MFFETLEIRLKSAFGGQDMGVESIKNACKGAKVRQNALKQHKFERFFAGFERFLMIFSVF